MIDGDGDGDGELTDLTELIELTELTELIELTELTELIELIELTETWLNWLKYCSGPTCFSLHRLTLHVFLCIGKEKSQSLHIPSAFCHIIYR